MSFPPALEDLYQNENELSLLSRLRRKWRHSPEVRSSARNGLFNFSDYASQNVFLLLAIPFLVRSLGLSEFGIWILVNAFTGTTVVFSLGVGDAAVKFVSWYRGLEQEQEVLRIIRASLGLNLITSLCTGGVVFSLAGVLVERVFKISEGQSHIAIVSIRIGAVLIVLKWTEYLLVSILRAYERFDQAAVIATSSRFIVLVSAVLLARGGQHIDFILGFNAIVTFIGLFVFAIYIRANLPSVSFIPAFDRVSWKEISSFGLSSCAQSAASLIFSQADRLVVASSLGTVAVAQYSICVQIATPIHAAAAALFAFLFPSISKSVAQGGTSRARALVAPALAANTLFAAILTTFLLILGSRLIHLFTGTTWSESLAVLNIVIIAYAILAIAVVPHYLLLGLGEIRFVVLVNVIAGIFSLAFLVLSLRRLGMEGAAMSKLIYSCLLLLLFFGLQKRLKKTNQT